MKRSFIKTLMGTVLIASAVYSTSASALVVSLLGRPLLPSVVGGINLLPTSVSVGGPSILNSLIGVCLGNCNTNNTVPALQLGNIVTIVTNAPAVTPVPEAETIAMISLGLVVVGYRIKRRKVATVS